MDSSKFLKRYFLSFDPTVPPNLNASPSDIAYNNGELYYFDGNNWVSLTAMPDPPLGGDLSGTASNATVIGIQGVSVSNTVPTNGQVIAYDGAQYIPTTLSTDPNVGGDLSGTASNATVIGIQGVSVSNTAPTNGQVIAYDGSQYIPTTLSTPSNGSGTFAARPVSPSIGDTYTVTSGIRRGSIYKCETNGTWLLYTVNVPKLENCLGLFDGEKIIGRTASVLRKWVNIAPRGNGYDISWVSNNTPQPIIATSVTDLFAYDQTVQPTFLRGLLPTVGPLQPRSVAALFTPSGSTFGAPNFTVIAGWGGTAANGSGVSANALEICARANFANNWGLHYEGSLFQTAIASGTSPAVVVGTYDGTTARMYVNNTEIGSNVVALSGNGADGYFSIMSSYLSGSGPQSGTLYFAGAWDTTLSLSEVQTLNSLLRERYSIP